MRLEQQTPPTTADHWLIILPETPEVRNYRVQPIEITAFGSGPAVAIPVVTMKTILTTSLASVSAVLFTLLGSACTTDEAPVDNGENLCDGAKCDGPLDVPDSQVPSTPCDGVMVDMSGRSNKKIAGRLNDAISNLVLKTGTGCPTTYQTIIAKLREADKAKCPDPVQGQKTRFVSETAQLLGKPSGMRAVVTRTCDGRAEHDIMFSLFGLSPDMPALPSSVEFISFDKTAGVFNYYEATGGKINFFGNSKDMLKGPLPGGKARCAGCHTEGGLVMKELDTPWTHWEGDTTTPGAAEFATKFAKDLGSKDTGINMESLVRAGNTAWNTAKVAALKTASTQELLKPLFCTGDINLGSVNGSVSFLPGKSYIDRKLGGSGFSITNADYAAQIKANGQVVEGIPGKTDTFFPYTFVMRGAISSQYVDNLISAGIIDEDLAKDILMVDFTRPVFSTDRCDLLKKLPKLPAAKHNPNDIRAAIAATFKTAPAGSPGAELAKSVADKADGPKHAVRVTAFETACKALGSKTLVANALIVAASNRLTARGMPILEFQESMVSDNLQPAPGTRFDAKTCAVTTKFVPTL
jgi:hypothetical protein